MRLCVGTWQRCDARSQMHQESTTSTCHQHLPLVCVSTVAIVQAVHCDETDSDVYWTQAELAAGCLRFRGVRLPVRQAD